MQDSEKIKWVTDEDWMREAIQLAKLAEGRTSPNPIVGAILVSDRGEKIGEGYHQRAGTAHAEVHAFAQALKNFPDQINSATLYVTLEPCSTKGRTGACTDLILKHKVKRVVYGMDDPNPAHAGRAQEVLKGIQVIRGVLEEECRALNPVFIKWITQKTPYILLKMGQSLDGCLVRPEGEGQWITNERSRRLGRQLRTRVDAILIGAETLRRDNPRLTLHDVDCHVDHPQPCRIVLTHQSEVSKKYHLFEDQYAEKTLLMKADSIESLYQQCREKQITSLLVEGGSKIFQWFLKAGAWDELHVFTAPLLCGTDVKSFALADELKSQKLRLKTLKTVDQDIYTIYLSGS
jgi:diaminohydroxyphosphoribosylaminopyrimidine deaminase/5-amino-6-(5-phosphoribosylamino)uracil reductase